MSGVGGITEGGGSMGKHLMEMMKHMQPQQSGQGGQNDPVQMFQNIMQKQQQLTQGGSASPT